MNGKSVPNPISSVTYGFMHRNEVKDEKKS